MTLNYGPWYVSVSLNKVLQKYYLMIALSGLEGDNDVSRVKRGQWNKSLRNTDRL